MAIPVSGPIRLIGPNRRRIRDLDRNSPEDARTIQALVNSGWLVYEGPANVDANGWIIHDGADPRIVPPIPGIGGVRG